MVKAVIFDMDGVLIDSEPIHYKILNIFARDNGFFITEKEYDSYIGTTDISMWTIIKEAHSLPQPVEELVENHINECINYLRTNKEVRPIAGTVTLIKDLHKNNIKLAIASSAPRRRIDAVMEAFGLQGYFQAVSSGNDVKKGKPEPDIFLHSAKALGILPEKCIVIEDSRNGVTAAKSAGMKCIAYSNPNSGNQDISAADIVIKDFMELNYESIRKQIII